MSEHNGALSDIRARLQQEQAEISYLELQKFFARGVILIVHPSRNLIDVALQIHSDNAAAIEQLIEQSHLIRAHDEHAKQWVAEEASFQAVTMAPWVLVQET